MIDRVCRPGLLAAGVVIAVACSDSGPPPTVAAAPDSADQVLFGVVHNITLDGVLRIRLEADTAYFYSRTQTADLVGVVVQFHSPEGRPTSTVTSERGMYDWRTGNMEARGNVVAETPDRRRLTTETLRYDRATDRISGPQAFVFDSPDQHLEGDGFTSDPDFRQVETVHPRRGRIEGQGVRGP
jgi:LPS export ABC transporter protein LptC